jgi:predicted dehydrogenase
VHHVDLVQDLTGDAIENCSVVSSGSSPGVELTVLSGTLKRGALFAFVLGRRGVYQHTVSITGAKAVIEFSCHRANSWRTLRAGQDVGIRAQISESKEYLRQVPALARAFRTGGDWLDSYRVQWESFVSAVLEGAPVPCSFADAASAVNICAALTGVGTAV